MKKVSLVSAAVMAAISMSATAADWNTSDDGVYKVTNNGAVSHDTVTVTGEESSSATAHALLVLASGDVSFKNVTLQGYQISEGNTKTVGSYFKTWAKNLSIENLTLDSDPNGGYSINTLEFRALAGTSQAINISTATIKNGAVLRLQTGSDQNVNPDYSEVHISDLTLEGTSAIALGVATFTKESADKISIGTINVVGNEEGTSLSGIVGGAGKANRTVEISEVNVGNGTFTLAATKDDIPSEWMPSLSLSGLDKITLVGGGEDGVVDINLNEAQSKVVLGNIGQEGDGASATTLNVNLSEAAAASEEATVTVVQDATVASNATINVTADNMATGDAAQNIENLQTVANKVVQEGAEEGTSVADNVTLESNIFDKVSAQIGDDGLINTSTIRTIENAEVVGFAQLHSVGLMQWRSEMNHMQYRLGEIRDHKGYNNGVWVRAYNGKDKYGSQSVENEYIGIQAGYDHRIEGTNFIIGGAVNYAHGDSDFSAGEGDNHNVAFTAYGTWLADSGLFADITGKIGRLSNDVTIGGYTAGYDTNAVSLSAEAGWRVSVTNSFYVEPQVEMMYGHVSGSDYDTQNYKAKMDAVDMFVGRLGVQAGLVCPQNKGSVYLRASVLHDFDGEASTRFTDKANLAGPGRTVEDDLGGTWYELGIGAHYNVTDTTYIYADFQYADGDETESPWRWSLGIRKAF